MVETARRFTSAMCAPHGASIDDVADPPDGHQRVCSNDVTIDSRGLVYLADRQAGVDIVETSVY